MYSRKFIFIAILLLLVVSPLLGWRLSLTPKDNQAFTIPKERTKQELQKAIDTQFTTDNKTLYPDTKIVSYKRYNNWWYVVDTTQADHKTVSKMLFGDFYSDLSKVQIITLPGKQLPQYNISGMGVPYDALANLNGATQATSGETSNEQ